MSIEENRLIESARHLSSLYTVIIGVSLSVAIVNLISIENGLRSITVDSLFLFLAFIFTVVPFYHGAMRHIDDSYHLTNNHIKSSSLIFDFMLLFLHGVIFVILSMLLFNPGHFAWTLISILSVDVIWGVFVHHSTVDKETRGVERRWALINIIFVLVGVAFLVVFDIYLGEIVEKIKVSFVIFAFCATRTIVDYSLCSQFYFPKE